MVDGMGLLVVVAAGGGTCKGPLLKSGGVGGEVVAVEEVDGGWLREVW